MSNSLLYHEFEVRGYRYKRTEYRGGAATFTISQLRESKCCSQCGSEDVKDYAQVVDKLMDVLA